MTAEEALKQLESFGNEKIKTAHELTVALWKTENIDAQLLAMHE